MKQISKQKLFSKDSEICCITFCRQLLQSHVEGLARRKKKYQRHPEKGVERASVTRIPCVQTYQSLELEKDVNNYVYQLCSNQVNLAQVKKVIQCIFFTLRCRNGNSTYAQLLRSPMLLWHNIQDGTRFT